MNIKRLAQLIFLFVLAWWFTPLFNVILPIPSKDTVEGFLGDDLYGIIGDPILQLIRLTVWAVALGLVFKYVFPFLNFARPAANKYSTTKLYRRLKSVFSDVGVFAALFIFITFCASFFFFSVLKQVEKEKVLDELFDEYQREVKGKLIENNEAINKNESEAKKLIEYPFKLYYYFDPKGTWPLVKISELQSLYFHRRAKERSFWNAKELYEKHNWDFAYTKPSIYQFGRYVEKFQLQLKLEAESDSIQKQIRHFDYLTDEEKLALVPNKEVEKLFENWDVSFQELLLITVFGLWKGLLISSTVIFMILYFPNRFDPMRIFTKLPEFIQQGRFGQGGSAHFAGMVDEWASRFKKKENGLFMGRSMYNPLRYIGIQDDRHMITIAGSRSGKGTSAIIPNLLIWQGSTLVIDPKGTNAMVTARARKKINGEDNVHIVDPFEICSFGRKACFNPLEFLNPKSPSIREEISVIAEAIVVADPNQKEKHWDDGARTVIAGMIGHLITSDKYPKPNLTMLRNMISAPQNEQDELWVEMSVNEGAGRLPMDAANRVIRGLTTNEIASIISNADKHTEWLSSPAIKEVLSSSNFEFSDLKEKPTTIYLVLPPEYLETHNRFLRLFVNLVINQMSVGGRSEIPVLLMMDEFLALGRMQEVEKAFGLMAGYNLVMWPFIQDFGRLKDLYGKSVNAFIANSRAIQVFGITDEETTEFVSKNLGDKTIKSNHKNSGETRNVRLRTPPEVALDIAAESDRQYILRAGKTAMVLEKVKYFRSEPYRWLSKLRENKNFGWLKKLRTGIFSGLYDEDADFR